MIRAGHTTVGLPILLVALGGAVAGLSWWSLARDRADLPAAELALASAAARGPEAVHGLPDREFESQRSRNAQRPTSKAAQAADAEPEPERAARPASERGLREKYLALEKARPGALAAGARDALDGERPGAEKVAWLQALHASDATAALPWFEHACALSDPATAQGESPASFALEFMARSAVHDAEARAALGRVAVASGTVDVALRRRAASSFAALGDGADLQLLSQALLHEKDEALRAGVVVALEARTDPEIRLAADRLLAWLRPASAAFLARHEDGTH